MARVMTVLGYYGEVTVRTAVLVVLMAIVALGAVACASVEQTPTPTTNPTIVLNPTPTPGNTDPAVAAGLKVVQANGCTACHSTNGSSGVGPTWKGLYGHTVELSDGSSVTADDAYIHESIVDPNAKIVKRFNPGLMPQDFGTKLSEDDISNVIAYIKSLQ